MTYQSKKPIPLEQQTHIPYLKLVTIWCLSIIIKHIKYIYSDSTSFYFSVNDLDYNVKLGDLNRFENKLKKYKGFYAAKVNTDFLQKYNKLNLNFNNQVIAQKK